MSKSTSVKAWMVIGGIVVSVIAADIVFKISSNNRIESPDHEEVVKNLVNSEELILELTPRVRALAKSVTSLRLPDQESIDLFDGQVKVVSSLGIPSLRDVPFEFQSVNWNIEPSNQLASSSELRLWESIFDEIEKVEFAKFYIVKGEFKSSSVFDTELGFSGQFVRKTGGYLACHATIHVEWTKSDDLWRISGWDLKKFNSQQSRSLLFTEVLDSAVPNEGQRTRARRSIHEEITSRLLQGLPVGRSNQSAYPFFFPDSGTESPGVGIVDVNRDGWDDFYVTVNHGKNMLFVNQRDGTFTESSKQYGLDIDGDSSCSIFADFDNDGDSDVFIGRSRRSCLYLENENGKFLERTSENVDAEMPFMVSSISAADYNLDGLLDVYICTYSPDETRHRNGKDPLWVKHFLTDLQASSFYKRQRESHPFLDRTGPPNLLLVNKGDGKFEVSPESKSLELWKKSFQGSWCDFDDDGDPDLYVASDFSMDNLFRNDNGKFTDLTEEFSLSAAFGMGVSWGDYDNDGFTDLYVTNMFSKAGMRITSQLEGIDERFPKLATGNFLYRNDGSSFELVSGLKEPKLMVAKAGWAWGAQFIDFNNDGFLDIYSPNGFYTAPKEVAIDIDM